MFRNILLFCMLGLSIGYYGCGGGSGGGGSALEFNSRSNSPASTWPNGDVRFTFSQDFNEAEKAMMRTWMVEMEGRCVNLISFIEYSMAEFDQNGTGILLIYVGADNYATIGYSDHPWVRFRTSQPPEGIFKHEMVHVLGLHHEFIRPDRDRYITIHWDNVDGALRHKLFIQNTLYDMNVHPFDMKSITIHSYNQYDFSNNGGMTMEGLIYKGTQFSISAGDVAKIMAIYGK